MKGNQKELNNTMTKVLKRIAIIVTFAFAIISTTNAMKAGGALAPETAQAATMNYHNGGGSVYGVPGRHPGKPWFLFNVTGGGANMGTEAFCRNQSKGATHGISVRVNYSTGPSHALKALTWYFKYHRNGTGRRACQAFIWAKGRYSAMANGYEKYWKSIASTTGVGYVISYTASSSHEQGWYGYKYVKPKPEYDYIKYQTTLNLKYTYKLKVVKRDSLTGNPIQQGAFKISLDGKRIKVKKKPTIYTKNGYVIVEGQLPFKKKITSDRFKYCKNWNILEKDTKESLKNSVFHDKASAVKAAKKNFKEKKEAYREKIKESIHKWNVEEVQAPIGHFLVKGRTKIVRTSKNAGMQIVYFDDQPALTTVKVKKSAANPSLKIPLSGAKFALYANGTIATSDTTWLSLGGKKVGKGTLLATGTTDSNGNLTFATKVYPGSYYIKELSPPDGYLPSTKLYTFTLAQKRTSEPASLEYVCKVPNNEIFGHIKIKKTKGFSKELEGNVSFKITANQKVTFGGKTYNAGDTVQTITTDSSGIATSMNLFRGSYTVTQVNTSKDSVKTKPWTVTIDGVTNKEFSYDKNDVQFTIKKYMQKDKEEAKPEKNAVFQILKADGNAVVGTITTGEDGVGTYTTATSGNKELVYGEKYILHQTKGAEGYALAQDTKFILNDALNRQEYAFSFLDVNNTCILLKYKVDPVTGEKSPEKDAKFEITEIGEPTDPKSSNNSTLAQSFSSTEKSTDDGTKSVSNSTKSADDTSEDSSIDPAWKGVLGKSSAKAANDSDTNDSADNNTGSSGTTGGNTAPEATTQAAEATTKAEEATKPESGDLDPDYTNEDVLTLATNDAGIINLSELNLGTGKYKIHQVSGEEGYTMTGDITIRVDEDGKIYEGDEVKNTLQIVRNDYSEKNAVSIHKTMSDDDGNKDNEAGAVFSIFKADAKRSDGSAIIDMATALAKLPTTQLRQEFVSALAKKDVLGTITTDSDGDGSLELPKDVGEFVVLQTVGTPGYTLTDAAFSKNFSKTNEDKKLTVTEKGNKIYSFRANDAKEHKERVNVLKKKSDDEGATTTPEKDAAFQVIDLGILQESGINLDELKSLNTLTKCKAFAAKLPSNAIIGVMTTNAEGKSETALQVSSVVTKATNAGKDDSQTFTEDNSTEDNTEDDFTDEGADDEDDNAEIVSGDNDTDDGMDGDDSYNDNSNTVPNDPDDDQIAADGNNSASTENDPTADKGITDWNANVHTKGFVIIQTDGDAKYKIIRPIYSRDAVDQNSPNAGKESQLVKTRSKDPDTGMDVISYSFHAVDNLAKVPVQLTKMKRTAVTDSGDVLAPEANAVFGLYQEDTSGFDKEICRFTSNANGIATSRPVPMGSYKLKQISGEDGYQTLTSRTFVITEDDVSSNDGEEKPINLNERINDGKSFIDKETTVSFKVIKKSSEKGFKEHKGEQQLLKGAIFEIYKKADFDLAKGTPKEGKDYHRMLYTDKNGEAGCQLEFGDYVLYEKTAPLGYLIDEPATAFTLSADTTTIETIENVKSRRFTLTKTDTPIYGEIQGFKHGEILTKFDKENGEFVYEDQKEDTKVINSSTYTGITGAVYALYAKSDIVNDNGEVVWKAGKEISRATSGSDGKFVFTNPEWEKSTTMTSDKEFWCGEYYFKEISGPEGFTLDQNIYDVVVSWNESDKDLNTDDPMLDKDGFDDSDDIHTVGNHILTTGEKLNPLIKNAKTVEFTWKKVPAGSVDVSVDSRDNSKPAGDVWLYDDGKGNITISSCTDNAVIIFNAFSQGMFKDCTQLQHVYFDNINTSQVRNMKEMFSGCTALAELDISSFNFAPVWWTDGMFSGCTKLKSIYSAGIRQGDKDGEVQLIPFSISAIPLNNFCEDKKHTEGSKFTAGDFQFTMKYIRSDGAESGGVFSIVDVADEVESFVSDGPWSKDMKEVTINFKNGTVKDLACGSITVPITVISPDDLTNDLKINNHPVRVTNVYEQRQSISVNTLKVDAATQDSLDGAVIGIYALHDIYNAKGEVIVKAGQLIQKRQSDTEYGGVLFTDLPTDVYVAPEDKGKDLYEIREITPPPGYNGTDVKYRFKAGCDDNVHVEFKHTYSGDKGIIDENGNKVTSDDSAVYYDDCGVFSNTEKENLTIQKLWSKDKEKDRPKAVTFRIKDKKTDALLETVTLTAVNNWTSDVNFITKAQAAKMSDKDFKARYTVEEDVPEGYNHDEKNDLVLDRVNKKPVIRANNVGKNETKATIKKVWKDNNDAAHKRPTSIRAQLYCDGKSMGPGYIVTLPNKDGKWEDTIYPLEKYDTKTFEEHDYTWKEIYAGTVTGNKGTGYVDTYTRSTDDETEIILTNTLDTGAHVKKIWDDNNNAAKIRPSEVKVQLYRNGVNLGQCYQVTLNEANHWTGNIDNLDYEDKDGNKYTYSWKEMDADWLAKDDAITYIGYKAKYEATTINDQETTVITNTVNTTGNVSVYKELDKNDVYFSHGNPTFTFRLRGTDWKGNKVDLTKSVTYTEDDVKQSTGDKIRKEAIFSGVEMGTYTITESGMENLYQFNKVSTEGDNTRIGDDGKSAVITLGKDTTTGKFYATGTATFYNTSIRGSIKIVKYEDDSKSKPLAGVTFSIADKDGKEIGTATTNKNGEINFTNLKRGKYTLKETKTVAGHSLLSKPFTVNIPTTLTKKAAQEQKADLTKGKYNKTNDTYDFYDLTYTVVNNPKLNLPPTGAKDELKNYLPILLAMTAIVGVEVRITLGKRRRPH